MASSISANVFHVHELLPYKQRINSNATQQSGVNRVRIETSSRKMFFPSTPNIWQMQVFICMALVCDAWAFSRTSYEIVETYANASANQLRFRDFVPRPRSIQSDITATRNARGFQLHADGKDLQIAMEFIVPFLRIPVQRSMQMTSSALRNLVNLNTSTLLWTGLIVVVGAIVGIVAKLLQAPLVYGYGYGKKTRAAENTLDVNEHAPSIENFISILEAKMQKHHIDVPACVQRSICMYMKEAKAKQGILNAGTNWAQIVDGITSLESMQHYLAGTAMNNAIVASRSSLGCDQFYRSCAWLQPAQKFFKLLIKQLPILGIR